MASRAQAFHDKTGMTKTAGGLTCHDLVLGSDGLIHSKKKAGKVPPQLKPFIQAHEKVLKKRKGKESFEDHVIKKGTKAYKDFMKTAKKLAK
jgi:hypothetical protein